MSCWELYQPCDHKRCTKHFEAERQTGRDHVILPAMHAMMQQQLITDSAADVNQYCLMRKVLDAS